MNFIINQQLAQALVDYLVTKPYYEVAHFVAALQQIKPAPSVEPPALDDNSSTM